MQLVACFRCAELLSAFTDGAAKLTKYYKSATKKERKAAVKAAQKAVTEWQKE